jgi:hypothetical protein
MIECVQALLMYVAGLITGWIVCKLTREDDNV